MLVSESEVPSPLVTYSMPSGPKQTAAPLWPSDSHSMIVVADFGSMAGGGPAARV